MQERNLTQKEFLEKRGPFRFEVKPLDVNLAKIQHSLLEKVRAGLSLTENDKVKENFVSKSPRLQIKDVIVEILPSKIFSRKYSLWLMVTEKDGERQEGKRLLEGDVHQLESFLNSPSFLSECKGLVLYYDYIFKNFKSFRDYVDDIILRLVERVENEVPDTGDFDPVLEFFTNPSSDTREYVGRYGLRVYKMAKDVVPDPSKRYVEAAAYVPSGMYKADYVVASGTKEEILSVIRTDEFAMKLCNYYNDLTDLLHSNE